MFEGWVDKFTRRKVIFYFFFKTNVSLTEENKKFVSMLGYKSFQPAHVFSMFALVSLLIRTRHSFRIIIIIHKIVRYIYIYIYIQILCIYLKKIIRTIACVYIYYMKEMKHFFLNPFVHTLRPLYGSLVTERLNPSPSP